MPKEAEDQPGVIPPRGKVVFSDVQIPGRFEWWRLRFVSGETAHEAEVSTSGGEAYTLGQLFDPRFIPGLTGKRIVTLTGDLSGCSLDEEGTFVYLTERGAIKPLSLSVVDMAGPLLQAQNDVTLQVVSTLPMTPLAEIGPTTSMFAAVPSVVPARPISLGRIQRIVIRSYPSQASSQG